MQRSQSVRVIAAIALAALVNALLLTAILFQRVTVSWPRAGPAPPLNLDLNRPFPGKRPHENKTHERAQTPPFTNIPAPPSPVSPPPPSPLQVTPAPKGATSPAPANDDVQAKASAALRTLQACGDIADPSHADVRCGTAWRDRDEGIDPLSPAEGAEFAAGKPDMDARLARSAAMRKALGDHNGQGSSLYYGCTLTGGHIQCSTY